MGQAVADLPDPSQTASPADAQSADDLLSQLAGDEIDRLLSESNGDAAPADDISENASTPPAASEPTDEASQKNAAEKPDEQHSVAHSSDRSGESSAEPPPELLDLDKVLETAVADHNVAAAERAALQAHTQPTPAQRKQPADHSEHIELGDKRLPLFLRPLEWLSSPLDPWPEQLREVLGKVGLMTLVNALAVLAYVLFVRRHHH